MVADQPAREAGQDRREGREHGPYVTFQMAEVAVSRQMFADILTLIARLTGTAPRQHELFRDKPRKRRTGEEVRLDEGSTAICSANEGGPHRFGAPSSPPLPPCLADEARNAHPDAGKRGHPADVG